MLDQLLGLNHEGKDLSVLQVSLRGIIVFFAVMIMVRIADKRFLSRKTPLDAVLGFIMASMMARAVNGSAAFFPTLVGGFVVVAVHRILARLAVWSKGIGWFAKGSNDLVIENGRIIQEGLDRNDFTEADLLEDLRINGGVDSPAKVKSAHIERNGSISVVRMEPGSV
jgi:uncharacterized membrane protein YcaP (DUF421 family)